MRHLVAAPTLALLAVFTIAWSAPSPVSATVVAPLQEEEERDDRETEEQDTAAAAEEGEEPEEEDTIVTYADVITEEAVTSEGLFDTHMIDEELYYEIPLDLLGKEMLLLTRIARTADGVGYGGSKTNASTIRWERLKERVLLRLAGYQNFADDTTAISQAVRNSNFEPILMAFDIEVMSDDSAAAVIEVTDLFTSDVGLIGLPKFARDRHGVRSLDGDRTYIVRATAYPTNIELRRVVTYDASESPVTGSNTISMEMHHSMLVLPEEPMEPRLCDERVGFFSNTRVDYGLDEQRAESRCFITRWRLEPSDPGAYAQGVPVDPVEPIVYYIDPATPPKWVPYLKQGVEDWQPAFERAGFTNAIMARDAPTHDPNWSPEDARYSVIRYLASPIQNASGPHVHDPRTGEILESDIQWYHNVMNLLRNWFFVQTAAANEDARGVRFDDEVMGELIRFVSAHEVGHTIGLQHNMQASAAYPVERLRTRFVCEMGVAPSIMDYARFNYVAQPGDDTCYYPVVGPYDEFAVEWGYKLYPGEDRDSERNELRKLVDKMQRDPVYRFSSWTGADPTALTEAIGDDAMKASDYGVENLKRIVAKLTEWTYEEGEDYSQLQELYENVTAQWRRYNGHVLANIGGVVRTRKRQGQGGAPYAMVDRDRQRRAMEYLNRQVFSTPAWMLDADVLDRFQGTGAVDQIAGAQAAALNQVLGVARMKRLLEQEAFHGAAAYTLGEMFAELRAGVWTEATSGEATDIHRRNLQRAYLDRMKALLADQSAMRTDIAAFTHGELMTLGEELKAALDGGVAHQPTEWHFRDAVARVKAMLDPANGRP